jgi:5'-nucleotidase
MLFGLPSIALSQVFSDPAAVRWETARTLAPEVIRRLFHAGIDRHACLNVNFPDVPPEDAGPLTPTRQGAGIVKSINVIPRVDPRGFTYHWLQFQRERNDDLPDSESAVVRAGGIAVTPLRFERTGEEALEALRERLPRD